MMPNNCEKIPRERDTDENEIFNGSNHAQLSMRASRISPTTALEF